MKHNFKNEMLKYRGCSIAIMDVQAVLRQLFDEKKIDILDVFFGSPGEEFYLREVAEKAGVSAATTYRIVNKLVDIDVLEVVRHKKTKFYMLADNDITAQLDELFEEDVDPLELFVSHVRALDGVHKIVLHEKSGEKNNVLVVGAGLDSEAVNAKAKAIRDEYDFDLVVLTLSEDQYGQMSDMGLFPGNRKLLWKV